MAATTGIPSRCAACREPVIDGVAFCPGCGTPLHMPPAPSDGLRFAAPAPPPPPDLSLRMPSSSCTRTMALCLAIFPLFFLGLGGIHQFYAGRILYGVLQLLSAGGLFVWAIYDIICIANGTFRDAHDRPLARV